MATPDRLGDDEFTEADEKERQMEAESRYDHSRTNQCWSRTTELLDSKGQSGVQRLCIP